MGPGTLLGHPPLDLWGQFLSKSHTNCNPGQRGANPVGIIFFIALPWGCKKERELGSLERRGHFFKNRNVCNDKGGYSSFPRSYWKALRAPCFSSLGVAAPGQEWGFGKEKGMEGIDKAWLVSKVWKMCKDNHMAKGWDKNEMFYIQHART